MNDKPGEDLDGSGSRLLIIIIIIIIIIKMTREEDAWTIAT
jgi:hypothetical protein